MAKVKFAVDWTSSDGKTYKGGAVADIDGHDARSLASRGIVRAVAPNAKVTQGSTEKEK